MLLGFGCANAQSQSPQDHTTQSPPGHTSEGSKKAEKHHALSGIDPDHPFSIPTTINVVISGKLDAASQMTQNDANKEKNDGFSELFNAKITDYGLVLFTFVIAIFTIKLANATIALHSATNQLVTGGENNAERQLRAYVFSTAAHLDVTKEGFYKVTVDISNTGQTPAYNLRSWIAIQAMDPTATEFHRPPTDIKDTGSVCAGGKFILSEIRPKPAILLENDIRAGRAVLFVWGEVIYRDVFKKIRSHRFRFRYTLNELNKGMGLAATEEGNEDDDYSNDYA